MALFGEYNIGALYKETISVCIGDIKLLPSERALLYVIIYLSDHRTGFCYDPDTGRLARRDDLSDYVASDRLEFCDAFARLAQLEIICVLEDRGRTMIVLNDYLLRSLNRVLAKGARPALIITKCPDAPSVRANGRRGYVYIARAENGLHKIGRARNPEQRVRAFAGAVMPFVIELIHKIPSNDAVQAEKLLHQRYDHCRRTGEWFQLNEREVESLLGIRDLNF